ncbi:MAG TPA: lipase family protein [Polyangiales bacterium]
MTPPEQTTEAHKITRVASDHGEEGLAFGDPAATVSPIDELATRSGYDRELAYLMAVISTWAYSDERVLAAKLRYYGFPGAHIRLVAVQNNALLVATTAYLIQSASGKTAVLAFRGTDPANMITVLTDTQVMLQPFFGTRVHAGFHASVEVVWDDVHRALLAARDGQRLDDPTQQLPHKLEALYLTGHSLGGAMAVLAAARLSRPDYAHVVPTKLLRGVYTYGQPMVGDQAFAQYCEAAFGQRLFRHVFHNDLIPRYPPKMSLNYAHTGYDIRASALSAPWTQTREVSSRVDALLAVASVAANAVEARTSSRDVLPGPSIDDHSPAGYLEVSRYSLNPKASALTPDPSFLVKAADFVAEKFR